ncbi:MAG TPA: Lrp/AsnC family transcriptional regulator [Candidatus Thermoplasmatota archaeon]|nr:Lrp/AsnC family transcriptional regulator [Candidatus Thermoplasmatota archaeon]
MDGTDVSILRLLVEDGRATLQEIGERVGIRRPTVHARVKRLEAEGVIRGYHADVAPEAIGASLTALVFLQVTHGKGQDCLTACGKLGDALRRIPEVVEYHTLAGGEDAVAKVRARDVRDLERIVMKQISGLPGVERVRTSVVLSTHFERPPAVKARAAPAPRRSRART